MSDPVDVEDAPEERAAAERAGTAGPRQAAVPGGLASLILVFVGLLLLAIGFVGGLRSWVAEGFGIDRLLLLAVGFQFLYIALLLREKNRLQARFRELLDHILQTFYGKNYRRERQAIDILIEALEGRDPAACEAAAEHLKRLTGKDFGNDQAAWANWWESHRATFRRADAGPGGSRDAPGDGALSS